MIGISLDTDTRGDLPGFLMSNKIEYRILFGALTSPGRTAGSPPSLPPFSWGRTGRSKISTSAIWTRMPSTRKSGNCCRDGQETRQPPLEDVPPLPPGQNQECLPLARKPPESACTIKNRVPALKRTLG